MTDEELIESLRLWSRDDAADRIEALLNLNEALVKLMDDRDAKLVADLDGIKQSVCAIVAEIKGESHE